MRALADKWREEYDASFGEVVRALYLRATDAAHPQGVQAARLLAELLDELPNKKATAEVDIFSWLASLQRPTEPEALPGAR